MPRRSGHCLQAAETLAGDGIRAEVLDLRTLKPLDEATILRSVKKTGRLVVVHEANGLCGVGAEVAARVAEHAFADLKAPVVRLTRPGCARGRELGPRAGGRAAAGGDRRPREEVGGRAGARLSLGPASAPRRRG
jgi:hypothetical protein